MFIHKLNPTYPSNLFETILSHKSFKNVKIIKIKDGFIQTTKNFFYKVTKNKVLFKDKQKNFLFLVKKGTTAWNCLKNIGFLEPDLISAYNYKKFF